MFWSVTLSLLEGLREVVKLFALTLVFSLPLGLAVTFGSMSKCRPVSWFFNVLVWIVRGTPLMLQLILIFYGPGIWLGHNIWGSQRMLACTVAFVLNYACYFSVIYRGGIEGVPAGQREAGEARYTSTIRSRGIWSSPCRRCWIAGVRRRHRRCGPLTRSSSGSRIRWSGRPRSWWSG